MSKSAGQLTSEWKLTKWMVLLGGVLEVIALVLVQFPENKWIGIASLVVGGTLQVLSALGYQRSRAVVKAGEAHAVALGKGAASNVPFSGDQ